MNGRGCRSLLRSKIANRLTRSTSDVTFASLLSIDRAFEVRAFPVNQSSPEMLWLPSISKKRGRMVAGFALGSCLGRSSALLGAL